MPFPPIVPVNMCYSGAAEGADKWFGEAAKAAGHQVKHLSFAGHNFTDVRTQDIFQLPQNKLDEADKYVRRANKTLKRKFPTRSEYINNLIRRNYYQVESAKRVYAITTFDTDMKPRGGTSWAIQMAIDIGVEHIYVFDWLVGVWYRYNRENIFATWDAISPLNIPAAEGHYAGIGSREMPVEYRWVINNLYR